MNPNRHTGITAAGVPVDLPGLGAEPAEWIQTRKTCLYRASAGQSRPEILDQPR